MTTAESPFTQMIGRPVEPGLESAVLAVRIGAVPIEQVIPTLASWSFITLSHDDPANGPEHFKPLIVTGPDEVPMIAAFTAPDRAAAFGTEGMFAFRVPGAVLAAGARDQTGLVINPGSQPSLPLLAGGLAAMRTADRTIVARPPGSRDLSELELTIASHYAGNGSRKAVLGALPGSELLVVSRSDPGSGAGLHPATVTHDGRVFLAAWTHRDLIRDIPQPHWTITVLGAHLSGLVGDVAGVVIDPGTAFMSVVGLAEFDGTVPG